MGDKDPYLALLGIDWTYDNYVVNYLKRDTMEFKVDDIKVFHPLDPYVGPLYIETMENNVKVEYLDHLYVVTIGTREEYTNPTVDGSVSWRRIQSAGEDSELVFDCWQRDSYKIFSRRCTTIREYIWVGTEVREHLIYDGTLELKSLLVSMEENIVEDQRILVLDIAL